MPVPWSLGVLVGLGGGEGQDPDGRVCPHLQSSLASPPKRPLRGQFLSARAFGQGVGPTQLLPIHYMGLSLLGGGKWGVRRCSGGASSGVQESPPL